MKFKLIANPKIPSWLPAIMLGPEIDVTPEFRAKCNALYGRLFGYRRPYTMNGSGIIYGSPGTADILVKHGFEECEEHGCKFYPIKQIYAAIDGSL